MLSKQGEHSALILRAKVKKTVPSNDSIKSRVQVKPSHVRKNPVLHRKSRFADGNQRGRRVRTSDLKALLNKETGDWFA
jgi:hypothetical protein